MACSEARVYCNFCAVAFRAFDFSRLGRPKISWAGFVVRIWTIWAFEGCDPYNLLYCSFASSRIEYLTIPMPSSRSTTNFSENLMSQWKANLSNLKWNSSINSLKAIGSNKHFPITEEDHNSRENKTMYTQFCLKYSQASYIQQNNPSFEKYGENTWIFQLSLIQVRAVIYRDVEMMSCCSLGKQLVKRMWAIRQRNYSPRFRNLIWLEMVCSFCCYIWSLGCHFCLCRNSPSGNLSPCLLHDFDGVSGPADSNRFD